EQLGACLSLAPARRSSPDNPYTLAWKLQLVHQDWRPSSVFRRAKHCISLGIPHCFFDPELRLTLIRVHFDLRGVPHAQDQRQYTLGAYWSNRSASWRRPMRLSYQTCCAAIASHQPPLYRMRLAIRQWPQPGLQLLASSIWEIYHPTVDFGIEALTTEGREALGLHRILA